MEHVPTTDTSSRNSPRQSVKLRSVAVAILAAVVILVVVDYVRFDSMRTRLSRIVNEHGGRVYSVGGWPVGQEVLLRLDNVPNESEFGKLVNGIPKLQRFHVTIRLDFDVSNEALLKLQHLGAQGGIMVVENYVSTAEQDGD